MKLQRYLAGVLLIALLVAGTLLTASSWLTSFAAPATETEANSVLPSDGSFQINLPMAGKVTLQYGASGELGDNLKAPTANEQTSLPDLGQLDLGLLLN